MNIARNLMAGCAALSLLLAAPAARSQSKRPNIVVIMADDIGLECYGAYGSTHYKTPRFDALAESGARFTHAYAQPLCTPSRVKIMTGLYNFRNYIDFGSMDVTKPTFGTMMRDAGYKTCIAGKWQLTPANLEGPHTAGFDEYCLWHFANQEKGKGDSEFNSKDSRYKGPLLYQNGVPIPDTDGKYGPDLCVDFLCDFMEKNKDEPFFVYYPMMLVHAPFQPTPDSADWPGVEKDTKYFDDMVAYMDKCTGRIVDKLDALGLRENTLLIVTGDNGTNKDITSPMPGGPVKGGKGLMTDAGTRVGFVANWPGKIKPGAVVEAPVDFADILPTMAEAAGTTPPAPVDGSSILPLMLGDASKARGWIFMSYSKNGLADAPYRCFVRDTRWKLYDDGKLYDVENDVLEQSPAAGPDADAARERLRPQLDRLMQEVHEAAKS